MSRKNQQAHRSWNEAELEALKRAYQAPTNDRLPLGQLARSFGRDKANVCRKARELGLTNQSRPKATQRRLYFFGPRYGREGSPALLAIKQRPLWTKHPHPRGMAGKQHTPETKAVLTERSRQRWAALSDEEHEAQVKKSLEVRHQNIVAGLTPAIHRNTYSRARRGRRADIGDQFFRSRWEANYARYLNWLLERGIIRSWAYEPKTFPLLFGHTYTPDFLVVERWSSSHGFDQWVERFHEVKGWLTIKSWKKMRRFERLYKTDVKLIDEEQYRVIESSQGPEISEWEWERPRVCA